MTRHITLPQHPRTYAALLLAAALGCIGAQILGLGAGAVLLVSGLGLVWALGRSFVTLHENEVTLHPFGWLGGYERVGYDEIVEVRTRGADEDALLLDVVTAEASYRLGPWQSFFVDDLTQHVEGLAGDLRARRGHNIEQHGRAPIPSTS
ncbi:MAG TPA: hypothetical protein VLC09_18030 [Polyangiaceae bacterium]|nr:hypothetical protein [Polyangiaceae bacterium]